MLPALEAILGQRSAHSLATGPVMADPEEEESRLRDHSSFSGKTTQLHDRPTESPSGLLLLFTSRPAWLKR